MQKLNQTEKAAFELRRKTQAKGTINAEKSTGRVYKLMYCGQEQYRSEYYHFCVAEKNRLKASGVNVKHYIIT